MEEKDVLERIKALEIEVARLAKGFPNDEPVKHCDYHENLITEAETHSKRVEEIKTEIGKKGAWGILLLIGYAVWEYVIKRALHG